MFEDKTFEAILENMLSRISDDVDKREGSIIYDALAPAAMELAEAYSELDLILNLSFADSSDGDHLTRRVAEHGVYREPATFAVRRIQITSTSDLPMDNVPIGQVFQLDDINYTITEKVAAGDYKSVSSVAGTEGNNSFGEVVPVEPIENLGSATLTDVLVPGEDEETDTALYERFQRYINEQPFGGNRADYSRKVLSIDGVGGARLYRTPEGGGTVKVTIISSDYSAPSAALVNDVQEVLDPTVNQGDGLGLAPIGHYVTVEGVTDMVVNVSTTLTLNAVTVGQVQPLVEQEIEEYLLSLREAWGDGETLTVRISQIEARLIGIQGVEDIQNTQINGSTNNQTVPEFMIPVLGSVTINV